MDKITTLLFDLDGTLINTNELIIASFLHTFDKFFPGQYKREDIYPFIGPTLKETFGAIDKDRMDEMIQTYREFNLHNHDEMITDFEGVYETIYSLKNAGYKLGIVTSKLHDVALRGLKLKKLDPMFDCLVGSDDIIKPKPDPEPVFKALDLLGSKPMEAMMIGDRHHDILAGKNAGTKSVGVSWTIQGRAYLENYAPNYILDNMADLLTILDLKN